MEEENPQNSPMDPTTLKKTAIDHGSLSCSRITVDEAYYFHYQQKDRYHRRRNAILHRIVEQ